MLISRAYAEEAAVAAAEVIPPAPQNPIMWNMGLIAILVAMFYLLLIRPQQKRFKEHTDMLGGLKKGDKIITAGGLVGTIEKIEAGDDEVIVDLGNGMKVTAMRHTIQAKTEKK